jgi:transcriptional regulator with XRE-family HTH domain
VRTLRRRAGLTGGELARRVGVSQSRISRIETGYLVPPDDEVDQLATELGASAQQHADLQESARAARAMLRSWRSLHARGFSQHQKEIARWERNATRQRLFQPNIIPGLLQTAEYARRAIELSTTAQDVSAAVAARVARQAILYERSKSFEFLITEGALRWRIVPAAIHVAALHQVISLSTLENVTVGVIPWSARVAAHQSNMFVLFDDAFGLVEMITGELPIDDKQQIAEYGATFNALRQIAATGEDARAELRRIAAELGRLG